MQKCGEYKTDEEVPGVHFGLQFAGVTLNSVLKECAFLESKISRFPPLAEKPEVLALVGNIKDDLKVLQRIVLAATPQELKLHLN